MGAGGVIIILKNIRNALSVGLAPSGNVKLWHALSATHAAVWALGKFL